VHARSPGKTLLDKPAVAPETRRSDFFNGPLAVVGTAAPGPMADGGLAQVLGR
jgi:hypothetical protein